MDTLSRFLRVLFSSHGLPREICRTSWPNWLVWLHNGSDLAIWLAYLAIPVVLSAFIHGRQRVPFRHLFWLFGLFIFSCGFTHFFEYYTTLTPSYGVAGLVKLVTALASWGTVIALISVVPKALAMRSPEDLQAEIRLRTGELELQAEALRETNARLTSEIRERIRVEELLRERSLDIERLNASLEERVQQRTASLSEANGELNSFAYTVSHDLRAPLRHLLGYVARLKQGLEGSSDEESKQNLGSIDRAAMKMGVLIDGLLSFSRMGRVEMSKGAVNSNDLVGDVVRLFHQDVATRDIEWIVHDLPPVQADRALLEAVWTNLIHNAVKFTSTRAHAVIEIGANTERAGFDTFYVQDNGVGFDMAHAQKLFGVFERLHHEDEFEGSGIGLASVLRIVQRHGGSVWADSQPDKGAIICFTIPKTS